MKKALQNTTQNNSVSLIEVKNGLPDTISVWAEAYFRFEVNTSESSRREQKRDLSLFRDFMLDACRSEERVQWSPRVSQAFKKHLKNGGPGSGKRGYSDRTINRIMAHLKTFAKWIHKLKPFPLGNPMAKIKLLPVGAGLEVERATPRPSASGSWMRPTPCQSRAGGPKTGTGTGPRPRRGRSAQAFDLTGTGPFCIA